MITTQHSNVNDLRPWLARKLRRQTVPDWLWQELETAGLLDGGDISHVELVQEAKRRLRRIRGSGTPPSRRQDRQPVGVRSLLTPAEEERALAFSEYIASLATGDPDLQRFRADVLEGRTLTNEEAHEFLRCQTLWYAPARELRARGIPVIGHKVLEHAYDTGPIGRPMPDGSTLPGYRHEARLSVTWGEKREDLYFNRNYFPATAEQVESDQPRLHLPAVDGPWYPVQIWSGTVLDEVRRLSQALEKQFPWNEPEATLYVLTGKPPFIPPIYFEPETPRLGHYAHTRLKLSVEPWVSTATVTRVYAHLKNATYERQSRALSEKNLRLFRFVTSRGLSGADVPAFESLMVSWNSAYPDDAYRSAWRFARDYRRVGTSIIFPPYTMFNSKATTAAKRR